MNSPIIEIPKQLWCELINHLRLTGGGTRESGAFLLGQKNSCGRTVKKILPYELLQSDALHDDHVSLSAGSFSKLWKFCSEQNFHVVADIHTHRFGPQQSISDKRNPMIAVAGHVALIVPRFAQGNIQLSDLGLHIYQGNHKWFSSFGNDVVKKIKFGEKYL